jgi:hypothetical protein
MYSSRHTSENVRRAREEYFKRDPATRGPVPDRLVYRPENRPPGLTMDELLREYTVEDQWIRASEIRWIKIRTICLTFLFAFIFYCLAHLAWYLLQRSFNSLVLTVAYEIVKRNF